MHYKLLIVVCVFFTSILNAQVEETIITNGAKLHYKVFGNGLPILIINGGPGMNCEGFIPLAKKLSEKYKCILYDQRGTGLSKVNKLDSSTINMPLMLADIEALRTHLNIKNWVVFGHSFGGIMAYYYASYYPENVIGMIQSSSGGMDLQLLENLNILSGLTDLERDSLQFYQQKIQMGDTSYAAAYKRGEFLAPAYVFDPTFIPIVAKRLTQGNSRVNALIWQNLRKLPYDTKASMSNFSKPVLILHGKQDIVDTSIPLNAKNILPKAKLVILENCKHYGWLDAEKVYFNAIDTFLKPLAI